ncbi:peptide ligase PGM1-related protein [Amycolatopsis sp. 195334CR]|uniref:preATP grasp domain-containing protein n=1 Tax=Amycolatopsis sp. 195334CR TaxID=2814588 RepID=UPI001A8DE5C9|nr:peptide ligase PGM1-related protein [Amycolatopsis sp. 195334CR]MBN6040419.1 hypothetical protein [Amycolatopsis sp. 195334CR]
MSTLLIGNSYNDHLVGDLRTFTPDERAVAGNISVRMLWLAEPGDVALLPQPPNPDFLAYLLHWKGMDQDAIEIVVPPPGAFGSDVLTRDRLADPGVRARLAELTRRRGLDRVLPYSFDRTVTALAAELGLHENTEGFGFAAAGGTDLLNSKSVFRAIAGGIGVPHTTGIATTERAEAESFAAGLLERGKAVIVKQDFHAGGYGNEILAPHDGVAKVGARHLSVVTGGEVPSHFGDRWAGYTNHGARPAVLEHYLPGSIALGAECVVTGRGFRLNHFGEMRMEPIFDGIAIHSEVGSATVREAYHDALVRLCEPVAAMGYRGLINIDGIITPDGGMLLTEFNGRVGGTSHLDWLGRALVGEDYFTESVMLTRNHWRVGSTAEAVAKVRAAGLEFDAGRGEGVLITGDHTAQTGVLEYCVLATEIPAAEALEKAIGGLFPELGGH